MPAPDVQCYPATLHSNYMLFFFFNDTATTEIYTLSLHDALPISNAHFVYLKILFAFHTSNSQHSQLIPNILLVDYCGDRKSTRLNSSHMSISYAVFCLKKKKPTQQVIITSPQPNILGIPPIHQPY